MKILTEQQLQLAIQAQRLMASGHLMTAKALVKLIKEG